MDQLKDMISRMKLYSKEAPKRDYKCSTCRDQGYFKDEETNQMILCECEKRKRAKKRMEKQGFKKGVMTLKDFNIDDQISKRMKAIAERYIENYPSGSLAVMGQVGAGKTHLIIGVAQELIDKGHSVTYMPYVDMMMQLRQSIFNFEAYEKIMNDLKKCELLVIDDFLKGNILPNDLSIIFELINYRYLNQLNFVISSEKLLDEIIQIDEALGTRISQVTKGYRVQVKKDAKRNKRIVK